LGDEVVNHSPDFQIYQYDRQLIKAFGEEGTDHICWPSSLAHRMIYFQRARSASFPELKLDQDPLLNVQKFITACRTSLKGGTSQKRKLPCIRDFIRRSGYSVVAYSIGSASDVRKNRRSVRIEDLLDPIRKDYGVILHVGWYKLDSGKRAWIGRGSHSLNAYGFQYNAHSKPNEIKLYVSNPGTDYSARASDQMFDLVEVKPLERESGIVYPGGADLVVTGPGFSREGRLAVLEDVFVFTPTSNRP
jgi:hypothetical protein